MQVLKLSQILFVNQNTKENQRNTTFLDLWPFRFSYATNLLNLVDGPPEHVNLACLTCGPKVTRPQR